MNAIDRYKILSFLGEDM